MKYKVLWILAFAGLLGDFTLTLYGLSIGFQELNPFVREAILHFGTVGGMAILTFVQASVFALGIYFQEQTEQLDWLPVFAAFSTAMFPVVWNTTMILVVS